MDSPVRRRRPHLAWSRNAYNIHHGNLTLVNERFGVGTRRRNHETHGSGSDSHSRHSRCPNLEAEPVVEGDVPQVHRPSLVGCRHLLPVYLSDLAASHIWHNRLDDDCFW